MKLLRWVLFAPAFILVAAIGEAIGILVFDWLYDLVFPIKDIWDYMAFGVFIPVLIMIPLLFTSVLMKTMIAPNKRIGGFILIPILIIFIGIDYYFRFNSLRWIRIVFDVLAIISLLMVIAEAKKEIEARRKLMQDRVFEKMGMRIKVKEREVV